LNLKRPISFLFKSRQIPSWWLRFTNNYPFFPNLFAVVGLGWICLSIAHNLELPERHPQGTIVEMLKVVSGSQFLVDKVIGLRDTYHHFFPEETRIILANIFTNWILWLAIPFILFLELLFPCNPAQPLIGKGFLQDVIWYIANIPLAFLILFPIIKFLRGLFEQHFGFLIMDSATAWPMYLRIILALVLGEFFRWFNHLIRHKIHALWEFHAVHHSQKEINVFTDDRGHFVDLLISSLVDYVPFIIFQVSNAYAMSIIFLYRPIHNRFVHANIKINLGWLGYVFSSPQFHRVHHSSDPAHADKNFGVLFSFFDYLFGTATLSRFVYPETGIEDRRFPTEDKVGLLLLPRNWVLQMLYPFTKLFERKQPNPDLTKVELPMPFLSPEIEGKVEEK
jgi:sterol desaturase/sphingolipid hydroxylase (fatty acid hydroxylase superfamily)